VQEQCKTWLAVAPSSFPPHLLFERLCLIEQRLRESADAEEEDGREQRIVEDAKALCLRWVGRRKLELEQKEGEEELRKSRLWQMMKSTPKQLLFLPPPSSVVAVDAAAEEEVISCGCSGGKSRRGCFPFLLLLPPSHTHTHNRCGTKRCSCRGASLSCSALCRCRGCRNSKDTPIAQRKLKEEGEGKKKKAEGEGEADQHSSSLSMLRGQFRLTLEGREGKEGKEGEGSLGWALGQLLLKPCFSDVSFRVEGTLLFLFFFSSASSSSTAQQERN